MSECSSKYQFFITSVISKEVLIGFVVCIFYLIGCKQKLRICYGVDKVTREHKGLCFEKFEESSCLGMNDRLDRFVETHNLWEEKTVCLREYYPFQCNRRDKSSNFTYYSDQDMTSSKKTALISAVD